MGAVDRGQTHRVNVLLHSKDTEGRKQLVHSRDTESRKGARERRLRVVMRSSHYLQMLCMATAKGCR